MKFIIVIYCLLFLTSIRAQDHSRPPLVDHIELAAQLGMNDIWSEHAIAALPPNQRFNKVVDLDKGVGVGGSLDLEGYRMCMTTFVMATEFANRLYGDSVVVSYIVLADKKIRKIDNVEEMNSALLADKAYINVAWQYEVNDRQKVTLSLMCDDKHRNFVMALETR